MTERKFTIAIPCDSFDAATLKLSGAKALITALGIFIGETADGDGEMPISSTLLAESMFGIGLLLDDVKLCLLARE